MEYLTFEEYQTYGGELPSATFNIYAMDAKALIDEKTFNRLTKMKSLPDPVKRCMFILIDLQDQQHECFVTDSDSADVASQSNDGVSISYNKLSPKQRLMQLKQLQLNTVYLYLAGVVDDRNRPILYRGIYDDE